MKTLLTAATVLSLSFPAAAQAVNYQAGVFGSAQKGFSFLAHADVQAHLMFVYRGDEWVHGGLPNDVRDLRVLSSGDALKLVVEIPSFDPENRDVQEVQLGLIAVTGGTILTGSIPLFELLGGNELELLQSDEQLFVEFAGLLDEVLDGRPQIPGSYDPTAPGERPEIPGSYVPTAPEERPEIPGSYDPTAPEERPEIPGSYDPTAPEERPEIPGSYDPTAPEERPEIPGSFDPRDPDERPVVPFDRRAQAPDERADGIGFGHSDVTPDDPNFVRVQLGQL